jgi:hypothetical protein
MNLRVIKYFLNLVGLFFFSLFIAYPFNVDNAYPNCVVGKERIYHNIFGLLPYFLLYFSVSTVLNYIGERYLEKRKTSKEFLLILIVSTLLIIAATTYFSVDFFRRCCE